MKRNYKKLRAIFLVYFFIFTTTGFAAFLVEESIQQAGGGIYALAPLRPTTLEEAEMLRNAMYDALQPYEKLTDELEAFNLACGWINPWTYYWAKLYVYGCRANAKMQKFSADFKYQQFKAKPTTTTPTIVNQTLQRKVDLKFVLENVTGPITLTPPINSTFIVSWTKSDGTVGELKDVTSVYIAVDRYDKKCLYISLQTKLLKQSFGSVKQVHVHT